MTSPNLGDTMVDIDDRSGTAHQAGADDLSAAKTAPEILRNLSRSYSDSARSMLIMVCRCCLGLSFIFPTARSAAASVRPIGCSSTIRCHGETSGSHSDLTWPLYENLIVGGKVSI